MTTLLNIKPLADNRFEIELEMPDRLGVLSVVSGLFASRGIAIHKAKATTQGNVAIDTFEVSLSEPTDWESLDQDLQTFIQKIKRREMEEVRSEINNRLISYLRHLPQSDEKLPPISLEVNQHISPSETVINIEAQDTPAFLYSLTNALSMLGLNVVKLEASTEGNQVSDRLWITTSDHQKVTSDRQLKAIQWAVLFVKQFTHMLAKVPDPKAALEQVTLFGKDVFEREDFSELLLTLEDQSVMERVSRILGTSRYLWEEFIRTQHDAIFPILADSTMVKKKKSKAEMQSELERLLSDATAYEDKERVLNDYKDREMFRIDLRHILGRVSYLGEFAEEFTELCEVICIQAGKVVEDELSKERPGLAGDLSICALGKFGGLELGYASDLEIMFVYRDRPEDPVQKRQEVNEFYCDVVRKFTKLIHSRSEGVFEVDLRLRPHGKDGPLAASYEGFKSYYQAGGDAWDFERQALIRLRPISGSESLQKDILKVRDEFTYGGTPYDFKEAAKLRKKQQKELVKKLTKNAKYSEGGLLDLEYLVQALQMIYGPRLEGDVRNPSVLKALRALWQEGIMDEKQFQTLRACYLFQRSVINALRIVRGNAKDLTIPKKSSQEFLSLARRVGYAGEDQKVVGDFNDAINRYMDIAKNAYKSWMHELEDRQKRNDYQAKYAKQNPGLLRVSLNDLLIGDLTSSAIQTLGSLGFHDVSEAVSRFKRLCPNSRNFEPFALAVDDAWRYWVEIPDADLALKNLEYFLDVVPHVEIFWARAADSPDVFKRIVTLFGTSKYLSNIIVEHPEYWQWLCHDQEISLSRSRDEIKRAFGQVNQLDELQTIRHRETLRIVLAWLFNQEPLQNVYQVFSELANHILEAVLMKHDLHKHVSIIALGKHGGNELNFSSDIDLMFIADDKSNTVDLIPKLQQFLNDLKQGGPIQMLYRVDLRLRPHGNDGRLVLSASDAAEYYLKEADHWEHQVLIKAQTVAGRMDLGKKFLETVLPKTYRESWEQEGVERIRAIKRKYEDKSKADGKWESHIKLGEGGIRDAEFTVQMLQLKYGYKEQALQQRNMFDAIEALRTKEFLTGDEVESVMSAYVLLRRVENILHLYDNSQVFDLPSEPRDLERLAKSLGYFNQEGNNAVDQFQEELKKRRLVCRELFERVFYG